MGQKVFYFLLNSILNIVVTMRGGYDYYFLQLETLEASFRCLVIFEVIFDRWFLKETATVVKVN